MFKNNQTKGNTVPVVILDKNTSKLHNSDPSPVWMGPVCSKQVQKEVYGILRKRIKEAGLAQLYALDKKIDRHYNNGTLNAIQFGNLTVLAMQEIAKAEIELEEGDANV